MIVNYVASLKSISSYGFYIEILEHCYHFSRQKLYSLATGQGGSFLNFRIKSGKYTFLVARQGGFIWCNPYEVGRCFRIYLQDSR